MFNIIIIDDELHAQQVLEKLIFKSGLPVKVIASSNNLLQGIELIRKHNPQIVFLDVQMPNYAGFEIVNFIKEINFEIIFVTAYDNYAINAFEINAIDYILKPIDKNHLNKALGKAISAIKKKKALNKYDKLVKAFQKEKPLRLIIPELNYRRFLNIKDILAIQALGAYTKIYLSNANPITTSKNLKYFEERLEHTKLFFRSHRSWIVQLNKINSFNRTSGNLAIEGLEFQAKISRNLYDSLEINLL